MSKTLEKRTYERLLTDKQFAERLGVDRCTVWRYAKKLPGFPQTVEFAGVRRWKESEVVRYLETLPRSTASK